MGLTDLSSRSYAVGRIKRNVNIAAAFILLIALGLFAWIVSNSRKPQLSPSHDSLHGLILSDVKVEGLIGFSGETKPSQAQKRSGPSPFMNWAPSPSPEFAQQLQRSVLLRLQRGGVRFLPIVLPDSEGYVPSVDPKLKKELVLWVDIRSRGDIVYYHIDIGIQQPVYLSDARVAAITATTWHSSASGGAPATKAGQAIATDVNSLVDTFIASYTQSNHGPAAR
jgi:hypothetical protein